LFVPASLVDSQTTDLAPLRPHPRPGEPPWWCGWPPPPAPFFPSDPSPAALQRPGV